MVRRSSLMSKSTKLGKTTRKRITRSVAVICVVCTWFAGTVIAFAGVNAQLTAELSGTHDIQVKGEGFPILASVTITYQYGEEQAVHTKKSNATGDFNDEFSVPDTYSGAVEITAEARRAKVTSTPQTEPPAAPGTNNTAKPQTSIPKKSNGTVSADTTVMVEGQVPQRPATERVASPNASPIADPASLTGEKIAIGCSDNPEVLNGKSLGPGTVVSIDRGCTWTDVRVTISGNGTAAQPILVQSVGDAALPAPTFSAKKGGDGKDGGIITLEGSNIHLSGVTVNDAESIGIGANASNSVLDNIEGFNVVAGVWVRGDGTKIWNSYFHDLRLMGGTPGGNDDYGANGVTVEANNVVIEGLTCRRCKASSADYDQYGGDGSFVEVWNKAENLQVRYGVVIVSARVLEAGGIEGQSARNMLLEYVYAEDISDQPIYLNNGGDYGGINTSDFTERFNSIEKD